MTQITTVLTVKQHKNKHENGNWFIVMRGSN